MTTPRTSRTPGTDRLGVGEARRRLPELTVIDVRTPGEYASGHVPGALNVPLDRLESALPALRKAEAELLIVCRSGARSEEARTLLTRHGVPAADLTGGTNAWAAEGHELHRPSGGARATWAMERQVRLTAGALVLVGLGLGLLHPAWLSLSAAIAGGLVLSAVTDTCGMAAVLSRLPHNRPRPADLDTTLAALAARGAR
ncbi:rhodanese-like domain-containing protein [Streptomyces caniscabiei]|uniref:Rhodanese-like domain-containing protein n=1 Tax=Streptomyces caniscabiei TaxID=2746961 RepID=A0ABU4MX78_9ACTN|nr:rhodanese-like domain-containing protein [Streptomyces caniscabiei]MBE4733840.1 rhodanese-like domain-containing protein [Streptomyces caniscabiei]MBE4755017.1 rhodanese-like domain-containing protein [Streptomyces caniscabiei]MBE4768163.1 rhodanese-like domain-containing protein [Streptomyces caniscabiei]MBE4782335.1 rhodanese-like domain-containing protein [Streptomyces caniscabiei]MBE4793623.1 rhodanese-like domain-containing protein [Streptomyces caniscabiei]